MTSKTEQGVRDTTTPRFRFVGDREGNVTGLIFSCPRRESCRCGISIAPAQNANGASWRWNGDRERPTVEPSINCNGSSGCGWHGWLRDGVLTDA